MYNDPLWAEPFIGDHFLRRNAFEVGKPRTVWPAQILRIALEHYCVLYIHFLKSDYYLYTYRQTGSRCPTMSFINIDLA